MIGLQGIYKIINTVNGKIYIGSSQDIKKRWKTHRAHLKGNYHHNIHLQNAWNKYGEGKFSFSILEKVNNTSKLVEQEQYYIDSLDPEYNIMPKAGRSKFSEESKRRMSESTKGMYEGEDNPMYGKTRKQSVKDAISKAKEGSNRSEATKKRIGRAIKGKFEGEKHPRSKLTERKVKLIRRLLRDTNLAQDSIAEKFDIAQTTVSKIKLGKRWSHI